MMRCVDGGHASKASHDAQGARRSPALPRGMSPFGPVWSRSAADSFRLNWAEERPAIRRALQRDGRAIFYAGKQDVRLFRHTLCENCRKIR